MPHVKETVFRDLLHAWGVDLENWKCASPSSGSSTSLGGASSTAEGKETTADETSSTAPASEDCCFLDLRLGK